MMSAWELGAMLYVPATHRALEEIGNGRKYPSLKSVAFCTEDAIAETDVPRALDYLEATIAQFERVKIKRFVRVRNPAVFRTILSFKGAENLDGFILPKISDENLDAYLQKLPGGFSGRLMLTLETRATFDVRRMIDLREKLLSSRWRSQILALRIGGNDLLNLLSMRRPRGRTIYTTPVGLIIHQLVTVFRPFGFDLSGPVFEYLEDEKTLAREARKDLASGLVGKTAIHPKQVPIIEKQYAVSRRDLAAAERILSAGTTAIFRWDGAMCEPATHRRWAEEILLRSRLFGIRESERSFNMPVEDV